MLRYARCSLYALLVVAVVAIAAACSSSKSCLNSAPRIASPTCPSRHAIARSLRAPVLQRRHTGPASRRHIVFRTFQSPVVGDTFDASTGNWSKAASGYTYQWQDCTGMSASATNWQIGSSSLGSAGTAISGITTDYFGSTRNVSTPSIGFYEFPH